MALKTWGAGSAGGTDGQWDNPANWDSDTLPVTGDDVTTIGAGNPMTTGPSVAISLNSLEAGEAIVFSNIDITGWMNVVNGTFQGFFSNLQDNPTGPQPSFAYILILEADSDIGVGQHLLVGFLSNSGGAGVNKLLQRKDSVLQIDSNSDKTTYIDYHSSVQQYNVVKHLNSTELSPGQTYIKQCQSFTTTASEYEFNRLVVDTCCVKFSIYLADGSQKPTGVALYEKILNPKQKSYKFYKEFWLDTPITLSASTQYCAVFEYNFRNLGGIYDIEDIRTLYYGESLGAGEKWKYFDSTTQDYVDLSTTVRKTFSLDLLEDTFIESNPFVVRGVVKCSHFKTRPVTSPDKAGHGDIVAYKSLTIDGVNHGDLTVVTGVDYLTSNKMATSQIKYSFGGLTYWDHQYVVTPTTFHRLATKTMGSYLNGIGGSCEIYLLPGSLGEYYRLSLFSISDIDCFVNDSSTDNLLIIQTAGGFVYHNQAGAIADELTTVSFLGGVTANNIENNISPYGNQKLQVHCWDKKSAFLGYGTNYNNGITSLGLNNAHTDYFGFEYGALSGLFGILYNRDITFGGGAS